MAFIVPIVMGIAGAVGGAASAGAVALGATAATAATIGTVATGVAATGIVGGAVAGTVLAGKGFADAQKTKANAYADAMKKQGNSTSVLDNSVSESEAARRAQISTTKSATANVLSNVQTENAFTGAKPLLKTKLGSGASVI